MLVAFELSMPRNNSWNKRWSGEAKRFVKVINVGNAAKTIERYRATCGHRFHYDFGDGWCAAIDVREVDSIEAAKLRKESDGFCGYDWMVESIQDYGDIYGPMRPKPKEVTA